MDQSAQRTQHNPAIGALCLCDLENLDPNQIRSDLSQDLGNWVARYAIDLGVGAIVAGADMSRSSALIRETLAIQNWGIHTRYSVGMGKNGAEKAILNEVSADNHLHNRDAIVIMSGDGSFIEIATRVKTLGMKVTVVAFPERTHWKLKKVADQFIPFQPSFNLAFGA